MVTTIMGDIHSHPLPCVTCFQSSFSPSSWCWVNWLAHLTVFDNLFNFYLGRCWIDMSHEILDAWMFTLHMDVFYLLLAHCARCGSADLTNKLGTHLHSNVPFVGHLYQLVCKVAVWCNQCYAVWSLSETRLFKVSSSCLISILLPWCIFLLFQSAYQTSSGRHKGSQCTSATSLSATVVLG